MSNRLLRITLVASLTAVLAACASAGGSGGAGRAGRAELGQGTSGRDVVVAAAADPAPIVSGTMRPYQIRGRWYRPTEDPDYNQTGLASWYGDQFNGRPTATGERFDMHQLTAAHKTLPLPSLVEVTNLSTGRSAVLRVNDRGPFVDDRIIDLSRGAAEDLGLLSKGVGEVRVRYLGPAPRLGGSRPTGSRPTVARSSVAARDVPTRSGPTPYVAAPAPTEVAPVEERRRFWVQAGSFADPLAARLSAESLGGAARVNPVEVDGRPMFRVVVGPWDDANAAEQARLAIVARGARDALLISGR